MRQIVHRYIDPLDQIWLAAAGRIGLRVERSGDVYASTDGRHTLRLGEPAALDPDDCLAQMIFHELCHSLVEGPDAFARPDWGLDNTGPRDEAREHACLRLQAHLADRHGLREFLAPTTDYRAFFDRLPPDPLSPRRHPETIAAVLGLRRADKPPWGPHLDAALAATAQVVGIAAGFAAASALHATAVPAPGPHPTGLPPSPLADRACGGCAWRDDAGLCRQASPDPMAVAPEWPACARWEPGPLDCQECGACCRAAYHSVTIERGDPVVRRRPELVIDRGSYVELRRAGDRCAALAGGADPDDPFACTIYGERPQPCREFERGGENCLIARRRVGLSL